MRLLLLSSSNLHGYGYLDHSEPEIRSFLGERRRVAFVPHALREREAYTDTIRERLGRMGFDVIQVHGARDLDDSDAIFIGGGNTFRLLNALYERNLIPEIRQRVVSGLPYLGSSAGSVIAAPTIKTTNDMPIVQPPSFDALGLTSFHINAHYLDPDPTSTHMGETREERIAQFLEENDSPVVGLREGTMLRVESGTTTLLGITTARIFRRGRDPVEVQPGTAIDEYVG